MHSINCKKAQHDRKNFRRFVTLKALANLRQLDSLGFWQFALMYLYRSRLEYLEKSKMYSSRKNAFRFSTNLNNSRAMSMSAPSAINTDFTTVKFDDETTEWNNTGTSQAKSAMSHR